MEEIRRHLLFVSECIAMLDLSEIEKAVQALRLVKQAGGIVYTVGNGGSHATASHFANDLMKVAKVKAVCVGNMGSTVSAYGNDNGWERMFSDPLAELLTGKDCVVGFSCSGESVNVLNALELAIRKNIFTIGVTGVEGNNTINKIGAGVLVHTPSVDIRVQEDLHMMICHAIIRGLQEGE